MDFTLGRLKNIKMVKSKIKAVKCDNNIDDGVDGVYGVAAAATDR